MVGKSLLAHGFKNVINTISSLEILCKQKLWVKTNIFVMFLMALATSMVVQSCDILFFYIYGSAHHNLFF